MTALLLGTLLALGALGFVLYPIFFPPATRAVPRARVSTGPRGRPEVESWTQERETVVAALREIEFDRATGKLADADYEQLKRSYTARAVEAMRREGADAIAAAPSVDDEIEAAVAAYRARRTTCGTCGPRPEPDAVWCSSCGRYLPGSCAGCGAAITELGARFCGGCGERLAA